MHNVAIDQPVKEIRPLNTWILVCCIWLLMIFTFSPPEDWKQGLYGTQTILPPAMIKVLKLFSRVTCLGLLGFAAFRLLRHPQKGRIALLFVPVGVFTVWIFASIFWSPLRSVSLQQAASFAISILLAYVFACSWQSDRDTSIYFANISFVLLLISAGLLLLRFTAPQYGALTKVASGMFHSTTAGASASLGTISILGVFGIYRWRWSKILLVPALCVHVPVLILAGNRFSIILTLMFSAIMVVRFFRKHELAFFAILISVAGISYLMIDPGLKGPDFAIVKIEKYIMQGQSTVQFKTISGRTEMWNVMWQSFQKSPWIGHGYFVTSESGRIFVWGEWGNWTAHSLYLQVLVTSGIVGALAFLVSMAIPFCGLVSGAANVMGQPLLTFLFLIGLWFVLWGILNSSVVGPTQPETVLFAVVYGLGIKALHETWVSAETKVVSRETES